MGKGEGEVGRGREVERWGEGGWETWVEDEKWGGGREREGRKGGRWRMRCGEGGG